MRLRVLLTVLALALSLAGCGSRGGRSAAQGTLVVGETTEPISLNPMLLEGTIAGMVGSILYSFLVVDDANGNLVPDAAAELPTLTNGGISRDGLRITYHLRPGIRWHDGAPLTARDCVFTFHAIMDPRNNVPDRHGYDQIARVDAADERTVVVTLKRPYSPIVATFLALDANYPILPAHLMAGLPNLNALDTRRYTIGSGPFRLIEWQHGDHLTFAANESYFRGRPRLHRLVMRFVPSSATLANQLRTHEIDIAPSLSDPTIAAPLGGAPGLRIAVTPAWGVTMLYFNTESGANADAAVRRALSRAIDSNAVMRRATQEVYGSEHPWRGLFGAYEASSPQTPFDPATARAALDARGGKPVRTAYASRTVGASRSR